VPTPAAGNLLICSVVQQTIEWIELPLRAKGPHPTLSVLDDAKKWMILDDSVRTIMIVCDVFHC
jgi:hypothetical protein